MKKIRQLNIITVNNKDENGIYEIQSKIGNGLEFGYPIMGIECIKNLPIAFILFPNKMKSKLKLDGY